MPSPPVPESFCPACGNPTSEAMRGGRSRATCSSCQFVFWRNPLAAVAVILRDPQGRVLLVQRAGTRAGSWCIPCGHIEWEEEIRAAGRRELLEETGLEVEVGEVYAVLSNFHEPAAHSVGVWFLGVVVGGREHAGGDAAALGWFPPGDPPRPLAFPTDERVLAGLARGDRQIVPTSPGGETAGATDA